MKVTNKYNLPRAFVDYERSTKYSRGDASYSATDLIGPPRIRILRERHQDQMEIDIADRVFALLGTATHHILSTGVSSDDNIRWVGSKSEERLFAEVGGLKISGQIDLQELNSDDTVTVSDFKVCSWFALKGDPKPEWIEQLNIYAYLVETCTEQTVSNLQVYAIVRDWSRRMSEQTRGYPQAPIATVPIPLWSADARAVYVRERIRIHALADTSFDLEETEPPHCSDEERWMQPTKWALMKKGRKTAVKLFNSQFNAEEALVPFESAKTHHIEKRPGRYTRCEEDYCGVSKWCKQFKEHLT